MFFPDGFVPLFQVYSICHLAARDRFRGGEIDDGLAHPLDPCVNLYTELLFFRFFESRSEELWAFKIPNVLLRVDPFLFFQARIFDGPCPLDPAEAESALAYITPRLFVSKGMRVTCKVPQEAVDEFALGEAVDEARQMDGALLCWKAPQDMTDLEREIGRYLDHIYWKGAAGVDVGNGGNKPNGGIKEAYESFVKVCPHGKNASGLTWQEIERKTGWSRRQIQRAIAAHSGQELGK